jgi:hypothetical protein
MGAAKSGINPPRSTDPAYRHSASRRAYTPVFDGYDAQWLMRATTAVTELFERLAPYAASDIGLKRNPRIAQMS